MTFDIETKDTNGREGILDLNGKDILTPKYAPVSGDLDYLYQSEFVDEDSYDVFDLGVCTQWLTKQNIIELSKYPDSYKKFEDSLKAKIKKMCVKNPLLHFEFTSDIHSFSKTEYKLLLQLQYSTGASIIELPNIFSRKFDYSRRVNEALDWKNQKGIDKPLMGIACKTTDIGTLLKIKGIDGIGLNLNNGNGSYPLLYYAEDFIFDKSVDIWVHAFSAPRSLKVSDGEGTYGILINTFGVDSISPYVRKPGTGGPIKPGNVKYYSPLDYSVTNYSGLINEDHQDHKLSEFCDCSICRKNTAASMISGDVITLSDTRAHEILAHTNEANSFQNAIKENTSNDYLTSKRCALELVSYGR